MREREGERRREEREGEGGREKEREGETEGERVREREGERERQLLLFKETPVSVTICSAMIWLLDLWLLEWSPETVSVSGVRTRWNGC